MLDGWSILAAVAVQRGKQLRGVDEDLLAALGRRPECLQGGGVDDLGDRSGCHAFRPSNRFLQIEVGCRGALVELGLEDRATGGSVGKVDAYVPIEATRTDYRGIKVLDRVRRCHDEKLALVAVGLERGQELVDGPARLLIGSCVSPLGDGVELVEEEKTREMLQRSLKGLVDVLGRLAHDSAHQVSGGDVHQAEPVLTGNRSSEERLADSRRAMEQDAVPFDPVPLGVVRMLEHQPDRLANLLFQALHPPDVFERRELVGCLHLELAASAHTAEASHEVAERTQRGGRTRLHASTAWARAGRPAHSRRRRLGVRLRRRRFVAHLDPLSRSGVVAERPRACARHERLEETAEGKELERGIALQGTGIAAARATNGFLVSLCRASPTPCCAQKAHDDQDDEEEEEKGEHRPDLPRTTDPQPVREARRRFGRSKPRPSGRTGRRRLTTGRLG